MKRILRVAIALLTALAMALFASEVIRAKTAPTPEELLAQARKMIDLRAAGPFELQADVLAGPAGGKMQKGSYLLDWTAPDRYRVEIRGPDYDEIDVVSDGVLHRARAVDYEPLYAYQLKELMDIDGLFADFNRTVAMMRDPVLASGNGLRLETKKSKTPVPFMTAAGFIDWESPKLECVMPEHDVIEMCLDPKSGWLVTMSSSRMDNPEEFSFKDYKPFGTAVFPRDLYEKRDGIVVAMKVNRLASTPKFPAATFSPPADAKTVSWCENEIPATRLSLKAPLPVTADDFAGPEILYGQVRPDGSLSRMVILGTAGASADAAVTKLANLIHFKPATCDGKAVESETEFSIDYMDVAIAGVAASNVPDGGKDGYGVPTCAYCPPPQFSGKAFYDKVNGVELLSAVIGPDGRAHDISIIKRLGDGLDEEAIKAVREKWTFTPAKGPDGKPTAVRTLIEVDFRIR
jgi:TonB family protein